MTKRDTIKGGVEKAKAIIGARNEAVNRDHMFAIVIMRARGQNALIVDYGDLGTCCYADISKPSARRYQLQFFWSDTIFEGLKDRELGVTLDHEMWKGGEAEASGDLADDVFAAALPHFERHERADRWAGDPVASARELAASAAVMLCERWSSAPSEGEG